MTEVYDERRKLVFVNKGVLTDVKILADFSPDWGWAGWICFPYRLIHRPRLVGGELSARDRVLLARPLDCLADHPGFRCTDGALRHTQKTVIYTCRQRCPNRNDDRGKRSDFDNRYDRLLCSSCHRYTSHFGINGRCDFPD